jgi:predicted component of type VI protein secretion system
MPRLILMFKNKFLSAYPLAQEHGITIGRHNSNDIVVDNLAVSGYHARVDHQSDGFIITDLQSKNGTFINGSPIDKAVLGHKDTVTIGKHTLLADLTDELAVEDFAAVEGQAASAINSDKTMILDTPQGRQMRGEETAPPEPPRPKLDAILFLEGGQGEFDLSKRSVFSFGKSSEADVILTGFWGLLAGNPAATITKRAGDYFLRYSGGLIKPKRNGARVKGTVKLNHDDIVELGSVKVQIQLSRRTEK